MSHTYDNVKSVQDTDINAATPAAKYGGTEFAHPILKLQEKMGNQWVLNRTKGCTLFPQRCPTGGACHLCPEIGNRSVQKSIQPKLKIGRPNDKYEQEADRVAEQVMKMPEQKIQKKSSLPLKDASCGDRDLEEDIVQRQEEEPIKAKSNIEQITPLIQRKEDEEEELRMTSIAEHITLLIQKQSEEEEDDREMRMKVVNGQATQVGPGLLAKIQSMKCGGQPLPRNVRNFFEPKFGYDFGNVRVHNDAQATETVGAINAQAFTIGQDIVFSADRYSPKTPIGKKIIAHELAHVIQQNGNQNFLIPNKKTSSVKQTMLKSNNELMMQTQIETLPTIRAPAEFEVSSGLFIAWKTSPPDIPQEALAQIVLSSYHRIQVYIVADPRDHFDITAFLISRGIDLSRIYFLNWLTDTIWIRDFAPIWVVDANANMRLIDPFYYPNRFLDDILPYYFAYLFAIPAENINLMPIYLEGGNFMSNGDGVCVATESIEEPGDLSINPLPPYAVEQYFFTNIGCDRTLLLRPLEVQYPGEDNHGAPCTASVVEGTGHVDMFAKFINRNTVLLGEYQGVNPNPVADMVQQDFNNILEQNRNILESEGFTVMRVPMPPLPPIHLTNISRTPTGECIIIPIVRSYTNSLIINTGDGNRIVLVPSYGDPILDHEAELLYMELMPAYDIILIDSSTLIEWGGAVHCTTTLIPCQIDNCGDDLIVYFDFDQYILKESEKRAILMRNYPTYLLANPERMISIEGHADDVGRRTYNQRLSIRRATTVRNFLIDIAGVPSYGILPPIGFGEEDPRILGTSEYARGQNRRVEIGIE